MAIYLRRSALQSRLKALLFTRNLSFAPDRNRHPTMVPTTPTLKDLSSRMMEKCESLTKSEVEGANKRPDTELGSRSMPVAGKVDVSKWRKLDSRKLGIDRTKVSSSSYAVLKILQGEGFDTYLVGGCVRDLILNKVPKDFDVITTASLKQIKQLFHKCLIVGRRFPICLVSMKGCPIEVSSFETSSTHGNRKEELVPSQVPCGCDRKDLARWRNSLHRDFTINSLFYDPFVNKVYDYANGMMDLKSLKLRTLVPAQLSFEEDCARILRGLRIAARLGLSFSKETEAAIRKLSPSVTSLAKARLMMEMNYMLSYGAAKPSLSLLWRFNLLEILLPFQAAYLTEHARKRSCQSSAMLMELFSNLDKLVTCDQPSDSNLWIALLAFHTALVNKPQDALVVWTFASVLYHWTWEEAVQFAREHAQAATGFSPEITEARTVLSDEELAHRVTQLAYFVQYSIGSLVNKDTLIQSMSRFPGSQGSDLVFISQNAGYNTSRLFNTLVDDVEANNDQGRRCFKIDYHLLKKGDIHETSFVLGKVIMDTLKSGVHQASKVVEEEKDHLSSFSSNRKIQRSHSLLPTSIEPPHEKAKKQKMMGEIVNLIGDDSTEKPAVVNGKNTPVAAYSEVSWKHQKVVENDSVNRKPDEIAQNHQNKDKEGLKETMVTMASRWFNKLLWPQTVMEPNPLSSEHNIDPEEKEDRNFSEDSSIGKQETVINEELEKVTRDNSENETLEVANKESGCTDTDAAVPKSKKKARRVKPRTMEMVNNALPNPVLGIDQDTIENGGKKKKQDITENESGEVAKKRRKVKKESGSTNPDEVAPKSAKKARPATPEERQVSDSDQDKTKNEGGKKKKREKVKKESGGTDLDEVGPESKKKARPAKPRREEKEDQSLSEETATTKMKDLRKKVRRLKAKEEDKMVQENEEPGSREVKGSSSRAPENTKKDESDEKRSRIVLSSLFR